MTKVKDLDQPSKQSKMIGCIISALIGDAMGMPVEMMSRNEILLATSGKGITGFIDPIQNKIKSLMSLKAGQYTDDYQLTRAVAKSLIRCKGFDLNDCIMAHLDELKTSDCGFGKSTRENLRVLEKIFAESEASGEKPVLPARENLLGMGAGNGIGMKVAPLALHYSLDWHLRRKIIFDLGFVTHKDPQASMAGVLIASVIARVFNETLGYCSEEEFKPQREIMLRILSREVAEMENEYATGRTELREAMITLGQLAQSGEIDDPLIIAKTIGTGCYCAKSIPFSIGMFLSNPLNVRAAIINTINQGGDTDSNASMVGAMVGANLGVEAVPTEWKAFRPEYREAIRLAYDLFRIPGC